MRLAEETRQHVVGYCEVTLALIEAGRGRAESSYAHRERRAAAETFVTGLVEAYARAAEGLLAVGLADEEGAIEALGPLVAMLADDGLREPGVIRWAPDSDRGVRASGARRRSPGLPRRVLSSRRAPPGAPGHSRLLLAATACSAGDFDGAFARAGRFEIERATSLPFELGRSELCWGERLRRSRRAAAALSICGMRGRSSNASAHARSPHERAASSCSPASNPRPHASPRSAR